MSTARRLRALRPTSTPRNRPPCGSSYSTRMCSMRMAFATLVLVIYQGLFIDVIARSLCATGSKSIGIATRQPLQPLPTCISIHHFLHPALPFYTLPSARAPRNTVYLYCPSSDCNPYASDCNLLPSQAKAQPHPPVPQASSFSSSSQHHLPPYTHLSTRAPQKHCQPPLSKQRLQSLRIRLQPTPFQAKAQPQMPVPQASSHTCRPLRRPRA